MKILFTSDIHADSSHLESLCTKAANPAIDCVIIGGDLIPHHLPQPFSGGLIEAQIQYLESVLIPKITALKNQTNVSIYLDLGNDDLWEARNILKAYDGDLFHLLHLRRHSLTEKVDVLGYMNVPPTPFPRKDWEKPDSREAPYERGNRILLDGYVTRNGRIEKTVIDLDSDDTIENDMAQLTTFIKRPFVFVSHCPPYHTALDVLENGLHVGSRSIRRFIEKWSETGDLIVSLHGHIHESPFRSGSIQTHFGKSVCLNPGQESGPDPVFRYVIIELEDKRSIPKARVLTFP